MITIPLTRGKVALIDDEDFDLISSYRWHFSLSRGNSSGYAVASKPPRTRMHNLIFPPTSPDVTVDHINGNGLDNRRSNLRLATRSQQAANRKPRPHLRYKGISRLRNLWEAQIRDAGRSRRIGIFETAEEAAAAYNWAAVKVFGQYACLNDIDQDTYRRVADELERIDGAAIGLKGRRRYCIKKVRYASRESAQSQLHQLRSSGGDLRIKAYSCPWCAAWHVGKNKNAVLA